MGVGHLYELNLIIFFYNPLGKIRNNSSHPHYKLSISIINFQLLLLKVKNIKIEILFFVKI